MRAVSPRPGNRFDNGISVDGIISFTFLVGTALAESGESSTVLAYPQINVFMGDHAGH